MRMAASSMECALIMRISPTPVNLAADPHPGEPFPRKRGKMPEGQMGAKLAAKAQMKNLARLRGSLGIFAGLPPSPASRVLPPPCGGRVTGLREKGYGL